ncbi:glyoxylate/hydroxypyruvate reductase HPR3-like [Durio zibethinus]|uniref:Glyoxylate/hydroxypyruvate reductase HPR3-like n=1 Tax=Durio zibethinus TaxID=66656 RepID=A0A6P5YAW1_DURZI|nr:glyoxylate/hydroxypyruvate reductase HPR3-like [Durio zibethinus]
MTATDKTKFCRLIHQPSAISPMSNKETQVSSEELPIVLVHRLPSFKLPSKPSFNDHLLSDFHLLDPHDSPEPYDSFMSRHAPSIRALIIVGPTPITAEFLKLLPCLELIVGTSAGLDHIDLPACWSRGITVTDSGLAFSEDVADCAVGLLIDVLRRISAADRFVRGRMWPVKKEYPLGFKLGGKQVGIVGLGSIGSEVAKRLSAFRCSIAYTSRKKKQSVPFPFYANVCDLAANSDVLILCCALTEETYHIITKDVMVALGKTGVIINVGRGSLIDEKELVQCLVRGEIDGAGLDVFENEPNVPKELFGLDNVVLSPHCAVMTPQSFEALLQLISANLKAFFSNKPLLSVVSNE